MSFTLTDTQAVLHCS